MALSVGEIEAVLRARDEMTPVIQNAKNELQGLAPAAQSAGAAGEQAAGGMTIFGQSLERIVELVGATYLGTQLADLVKDTIALGQEIEDAGRATGVSAEAFQRWTYAAQLSGASANDVERAVNFMNKTLAGGSDSTVAALAEIGLGFDQIRGMNPEAAFTAISTAIMEIPDPMDQARVAMELFGRGALALLPAIKDNMLEVGDAALTMSGSTVDALDMIGDVGTVAGGTLKVMTGEFIAAIPWVAQIMADISNGSTKVKNLKTSVDELIPTLQHHTEVTKALTPAISENEKEWATWNKRMQESADVLTGQALATKVKDLAEQVRLAGVEGGITAYQEGLLAKQLEQLKIQGANLTPELDAIIMRHKQITLNVDLTRAAFLAEEQAAQEALGLTDDAINRTIVQSGNLVQALHGVENMWPQIKNTSGAAIEEMIAKHDHYVSVVQNATVQLLDGALHGWDSFKRALLNIFDEIVRYYEEKVAAKIAESIIDWIAGAGAAAGGGGFWTSLLSFFGFGGGGGNNPLPGEPPPGPPPSQNPGDPQPLPPGMAPPGVGPSPGPALPKPLAAGGLVTSPTVALIGESGPEYVIPAGQMGGGGGMVNVTLEMDGWTVARILAPYIPGEAKRYSLTRQ